jgi:mevalonate kinase
MKVFAPGKLILSGEHAVVYGHPALAMAVNRYAIATVTHEHLPQFLLDLSDLAHHSRLSLKSLMQLKERIKHKYHRFIHGDFSIREVLQKPFELAQFALSMVADKFHLAIPHGVKIHLQSDIPIGCGMGSSAATILCVMQAVSDYLQLALSQEHLFQLALQAEHMQHGQSSGLDLRVALSGGCVFVEAEQISKRPLPHLPLYLIHTGTPEVSTGQCVTQAASHFQSSHMGEAFAATTRAMDKALSTDSRLDFVAAIRENHQLLMRIGVVPATVSQLIARIEAIDGAAKICGAGAVRGEQAGAVLAIIEDQAALMALCKEFHYSCTSIRGEARGLHAI